MATFGKRLTELRTARHLNRSEVAHALNISLSHMSKLETGMVGASRDLVQRIADYYAIDADDLHRLAGTVVADVSAAATFGTYLRARREAHGLTKENLANQLGVSLSLISYVEADRRRPSPEVVTRLATVLGEDVDTLLARAGRLDCAALEQLASEEPEVGVILLRLPKLSRAQRRELVVAWRKMMDASA